jgi:HSP20 family protein
VRVDVPGIKREDLEVAVEGEMLVIRGKREEEKEVKEEDYYCSERATGEFSRAISLPEGVKAEDIEATCEDGVLEVVLPKAAVTEKPATKIQVK